MEEHAIFKGATRPPLLLGVPMLPLILMGLTCLLPIGLLIIVLHLFILPLVIAVIFFVTYFYMRHITKKDPWLLEAKRKRLILRRRKGNVTKWGGVSYGPTRMRREG